MEKKFYIKVNNTKIEVSEKIFTEYTRSKWKEEHQDRRNKKRNYSLEAMSEQEKEISNATLLEDEINDIFLYKK